MLPSSLLLLVSTILGGVAAAPATGLSARQQSAVPLIKQKVLIGGGGTSNITIAQFNGATFDILSTTSIGAGKAPSWLAFKEPNIVYSVNENAADLQMFKLDLTSNTLTPAALLNSSRGVVHLEFNKDKTRMVGSSYTQGVIDVWELAADGTPKAKTIGIKTNVTGSSPDVADTLGPNKARQADGPHAHQSVLDNSGRYFFVNDLGLDSIVMVDSQGDDFKVVGRTKVNPGCGPRHGVFYPPGAANATHYLVVCELLNTVIVHSVNFNTTSGVPEMIATQIVPTFGDSAPSAAGSKPQAGEIIASADGKSIYVSNRLGFDANTATSTDTLVQLKACFNATDSTLKLSFGQSVSSEGRSPRMISLSTDKEQTVLYGTNQRAGTGLVVFQRDAAGSLKAVEGSKVAYDKFATSPDQKEDFGPQFVIGLPNSA
ncbi:hypothetical protein RB595_008348 [Gaeumannomyces hyphopodioides]